MQFVDKTNILSNILLIAGIRPIVFTQSRSHTYNYFSTHKYTHTHTLAPTYSSYTPLILYSARDATRRRFVYRQDFHFLCGAVQCFEPALKRPIATHRQQSHYSCSLNAFTLARIFHLSYINYSKCRLRCAPRCSPMTSSTVSPARMQDRVDGTGVNMMRFSPYVFYRM